MANTYLNRTSIGTPTNRKKFTGSAWVKRARASANEAIIWTGSDSNNWTMFKFSTTNLVVQFRNSSSDVVFLETDRVFRDPSAWYHIVVSVDTTQSTSSDRVKLYVNGVQETSFSTATYPSQNLDLDTTTEQKIGLQHTTQYFDGEMSHVHFIDGTAYDASAFGSTDATTGEWVGKTSPSVTYGTNGFFILKDGNGITDQSGEGNDFTLGGGTLTDLKDNPDNVFATINPLDKDLTGTAATISYGNTRFSSSGNSSSNNGMRCTLGASSGKYYWEVKNVQNDLLLGIQDADATTRFTSSWTWGLTGTYAVKSNGDKSINVTQTSNAVPTFTTGDTLMLAMDLDNQKLYFGKNGTWSNSGDPTSGSTGTGSLGNLVSGATYIPVVSNASWSQNTIADFNFGNGYFGTTAVSSAGTNASDNGIFEYDVPTGYTALSTKGLNL